MTERFLRESRFVTLLGFEWQHSGYALERWVPGTDDDALEPDLERLIELWSMHDSSEGYDRTAPAVAGAEPSQSVMAALRDGRRFGFVAGSDTHGGRPGGSAVWVG